MQVRPSIVYLAGEPGAVSRRRSELLDQAGWDGSVLDAVDGEMLLTALRTPPMFAGRRVVAVENLEALRPEIAGEIAGVETANPALVIARSGEKAPSTKLLRSLGAVLVSEKCGSDRPADRRKRLAGLETEYGVRLDPRSRNILLDAYGEEIERSRSVLWQIALRGNVPTPADLGTMVAASCEAHVPWAPLDAFAAGDAAAALAELVTIEPVVALTFISRDLIAAALAAESGVRRSEELETALGLNRFAARRALRLADRIGSDGMARLWPALLDAEVAVRGKDARAAIALFVVRACLPRQS